MTGIEAIGAALTVEQQLFVSQKYPEFIEYVKTPEGKKALRTFVDTWRGVKSDKPAELPEVLVINGQSFMNVGESE